MRGGAGVSAAASPFRLSPPPWAVVRGRAASPPALHLHYGEKVNGAWRDPTYSPGGYSSSGGSAPMPSPLPALPNPSALLAN
ncbi:MAG TPA: hypothetical protein VIR57_16520, partial [Chloroflexota bacterium]